MFSYSNPVALHFDVDLKESLRHIKAQKILFLTSPSFEKNGSVECVKNILGKHLSAVVSSLSPNPTLQHLKNKRSHCGDFESIVALGGGSVIDSAKFLSVPEVLLQNGKLRADFEKALPIYAIPTTAGSSAELTPWASIWDFEKKVKYSLAHPNLFPQSAFYAPELTLSLPLESSLSTALDSLSHALESVWNKNANPISTHHAQKAITLFLQNLPQLPQRLNDLVLRKNLMQASVFAGLSFSNTQTALAHALSYPLTLNFKITHGWAVAFSLPALLDSLPNGKSKAVLEPFLKDLKKLFQALDLKTRFQFLTEQNVENLFSHLNERAKNSIFDLNTVKENLLKGYFH